MITFKKKQVKNTVTKGKWYASPVITETMDLDDIAKHMSSHNSLFSLGTIKGVLTDLVACIKEQVLEGKAVKLDNLAIFSVGIVSKTGADSAKDFSLSNNVKGLRLRARATGDLSNANLKTTLKELVEYTVADDGATSETPSDTSSDTPTESND